MADTGLSVEARILQAVRLTLARVIKDTATPHGMRHPLSDATIEDMARRYVQEIRTVRPHGPYLVGGWSFGGAVAYETAQQLQRAGETVELLVLVESRVVPPARAPEAMKTIEDLATLGYWYTLVLGRCAGVELPIARKDFSSEPSKMLLQVLEHLKTLGFVAPETGTAYVEHLLKLYALNMKALFNYRFEPYGGRTLLFKSQNEVPHIVGAPSPPKDFGWDGLLTGLVEEVSVPGNHFQVIYRPYVQHLANQLRIRLADLH